jgi:hypothetical protein
MLRDREGTVANSPHLRWRDVPFGRLLAARLGERYRIGVYNDVNAIVYGEAVAGAARGCRDVLGVYVGSAETMVDNGSDKGSAVVQTPPPITPDAAVAVAPPDAAVQVVQHDTGSANGSAGSATVTPVANVSLTINSVPAGADIYVNSAPSNQQTPATLKLPPGTYKITLRNKGFDDYRKTVSLKADQKVDASLKKYVPPTGQGSGKGKGSATKVCDTCLERPD